MDDQFFDGLTRTVAARATTRRGVLAGVLSGGSALLALLGGEAAAQCVAPGKKCKTRRGKKKCCGGAKCQGKRCECPGQRTACGKKCCKKNQVCAGDKCIAGAGTCPTSGEDWCNGGFTAICNGDPSCRCFTTMSGATRCGVSAANFCACTTDAECVASDGPGAFCFRFTVAPNCTGCNPGVGSCGVPCHSQG